MKMQIYSLVNHYVYKDAVMHLGDDGKPYHSCVKLTCPQTVKYSIRTLMKHYVY